MGRRVSRWEDLTPADRSDKRITGNGNPSKRSKATRKGGATGKGKGTRRG